MISDGMISDPNNYLGRGRGWVLCIQSGGSVRAVGWRADQPPPDQWEPDVWGLDVAAGAWFRTVGGNTRDGSQAWQPLPEGLWPDLPPPPPKRGGMRI